MEIKKNILGDSYLVFSKEEKNKYKLEISNLLGQDLEISFKPHRWDWKPDVYAKGVIYKNVIYFIRTFNRMSLNGVEKPPLTRVEIYPKVV